MTSYWRYVLNKLLIPLATASGLILAIVCLKLNGVF